MTRRSKPQTRLLSVHPSTWGLGFALFEGPERLIDWGVRGTGTGSAKERNARSLRVLEDLINSYQPDILVVENATRGASRRHDRIRSLIESILNEASRRGIERQTLSRSQLKACFPNAANKHELAVAIAERFPELGPRVPPYRKCWMSEDYRSTIFDAVAFGVTCLIFCRWTAGDEAARFES